MPCYLVFEIMHDGQPHAIPWLGCPVLEPFKDFRKASRLGVRMEWLQVNPWHSIPFQQQRFARYFHEGISDGDLMKDLWPWRKAMDIAQALEGTIHTDTEPLNGFDSQISPGSCDVLELQMDHLGQTARWVPRQARPEIAPQQATARDNALSLAEMFSEGLNNLTTLANQPEAAPTDLYFWRPSKSDCASAGKVIEALCDFCSYMMRQSQSASERDCCKPVFVGDSIYYQCKACWMFDRPCIWTARTDRWTRWGTGSPYLCTANHPLTSIPTGGHRRLSFHRTTEHD